MRALATQISATTGSTTATTSTVVVAANTYRRGLIFENQSDTAMFIRFGADATAGGAALTVAANSRIVFDAFVDYRALEVYCASSSKVWCCWEV